MKRTTSLEEICEKKELEKNQKIFSAIEKMYGFMAEVCSIREESGKEGRDSEKIKELLESKKKIETLLERVEEAKKNFSENYSLGIGQGSFENAAYHGPMNRFYDKLQSAAQLLEIKYHDLTVREGLLGKGSEGE